MALGGLGESKNAKCSHKPRVRVIFFLRSPFGEIWARYRNYGNGGPKWKMAIFWARRLKNDFWWVIKGPQPPTFGGFHPSNRCEINSKHHQWDTTFFWKFPKIPDFGPKTATVPATPSPHHHARNPNVDLNVLIGSQRGQKALNWP